MRVLRNWYTLAVVELSTETFECLRYGNISLWEECRFESYHAHMKKVCTLCACEKDLGEFARDKSRVDGRHSQCKVCRRANAKVKYTDTELTVRRARDRKRSARSNEIIAAYKSTGCELCPEREHVCLDFHHRHPSTKLFEIAGNRNSSEQRLLTELEKCAVLCANCHRKVHANILTL